MLMIKLSFFFFFLLLLLLFPIVTMINVATIGAQASHFLFLTTLRIMKRMNRENRNIRTAVNQPNTRLGEVAMKNTDKRTESMMIEKVDIIFDNEEGIANVICFERGAALADFLLGNPAILTD